MSAATKSCQKVFKLFDDLSRTQHDKLSATLQLWFPVKFGVDKLTKGYEFIYFNHAVSESRIDLDGFDNVHTPKMTINNGEIMARRWIGGFIKYNTELKLQQNALCVETQTTQHHKTYAKVTLNRDLNGSIFEEREYLYLVGSSQLLKKIANKQSSIPPLKNGFQMNINITEMLVWRFCALTFNAHLIHTNHKYTPMESLNTTLVPGPLLVTLMMQFAQQNNIEVESIRYQNTAHVFTNTKVTLIIDKLHGQALVNNKVVFECHFNEKAGS